MKLATGVLTLWSLLIKTNSSHIFIKNNGLFAGKDEKNAKRNCYKCTRSSDINIYDTNKIYAHVNNYNIINRICNRIA